MSNSPSSTFTFARNSPPVKSPSTPQASTSSQTTPRRRTPLAPRSNSKRSPARAWNRKLSFSSLEGTPAPSGTSTPLPIDTTTEPIGLGGFIFSPSKTSATWGLAELQESRQDVENNVFALDDMRMDIDEIVGMPVSPPRLASESKWSTVTTRKTRTKRVKTGVNDLPDELLLRIFGFLNDQQGFRPLPTKYSTTPGWYTPPLRVALVCKRWLPLVRHLAYRFLKISHLSRISSLYQSFAANADLPASVRHLAVDLPFSAAEKLDLVPSTDQPSIAREADSDLEPSAKFSTLSSSPSKSSKRSPTYADQLRAVFQSCAHLLSLDLAGVLPATLFTSSSNSLSALHHLHQLRLSTVTALFLHGSSETVLSSTSLRDALLALAGLRRLTLKSYVSSASCTLDFAPKTTPSGHVARPLPFRARACALVPLEKLILIECHMSPNDLRALLEHVRPGKLRHLVVDDVFTAAQARRYREEGYWAAPTVESLQGVASLLKTSLTTLRVTLFNYPLLTAQYPPITTSPSTLPVRRRITPVDVRPMHVLDGFIAQLENLVVLDVGGTVVTTALFEPVAPSSPSTPRTQSEVRFLLPSSIRHLLIRSCPAISPSILVILISSSSCPSSSSRLSKLSTFGGTEHGWASPSACWRLQQACWKAGVRWVSGAQSGIIVPVEKESDASGASYVGMNVRREGERSGGMW
ncbi:proteophosphoglycan ppg4 [Rhodotorula toruloides]|uniref:Proteophosphoglycan ppg4 n=1 Tax=Rhodotorula toruloides TaxID=5286 RepID=A0A511KFT5_RHOTO|nr:proteophosphoglycan ppg4 [Rhodotorula toruloides]